MELARLSEARGAFYQPSFSVRVAGRDLIRDEQIAVTQAEADLTIGAAGRFGFTLSNVFNTTQRAFKTADGRDLFSVIKLGAEVEVYMGYGTLRAEDRIVTGVITGVTTSFPDTGTPELSVSGTDHSFAMTNGKNTQSWSDVSDSDIVHTLAGDYNLTPDIQSTGERHPQVEQSQQSDFDFIKKLAEQHDYAFYVEGKKLRFGEPKMKSTSVLTLRWGEGLLNFKPEANLGGQFTEVEIRGWDIKQKKPIIGRASAGQERNRDAQRESAGDRLKRLAGVKRRTPVLKLRQPVFTQAEADSRAKAVLDDGAKKFITGDAESIGVPAIKPDRNVTLENLGTLFSKTYFVEQAVHRFDSSGYRTRFKVKGPTL